MLENLTYVIIGVRENDKWIFVRHRDRYSWELPAGHIEKGESAMEAAKRELWEETGVIEANLRPVQDYTITMNNSIKSGRIFLAQSIKRDGLPNYEIAEIKLSKLSPEPATYPEAHFSFLNFLNDYLH